MDEALTAELAEVLGRWQGEHVAVRVVTNSGDLLAVFSGVLAARSGEKHPAWFWPVDPAQALSGMLERRGIYAHRDLVADVREHEGGYVVEYVQDGVTVNVRRLGVRSEETPKRG